MSENDRSNDTKLMWELVPFTNKIRAMERSSKEYKLFNKAFFDFQEKFERAKYVYDILQKQSLSPPYLYSLFLYLGAIESYGNVVTNVLVLLLVANGHIFKIHNDILNFISLKDFEKKAEFVSLGYKLNFLERNNIKIKSFIDKDLRNKIAHLDFNIKNDEVFLRGKPALNVVMDGLKKLLEGIVAISTILNKLAIDEKWIT